MMIQKEAHSPGVLARDFGLFYLKLLLDGFKGVILVQLGILAFCVDMIFMLVAGSRRSFFYAVLELGERFDLWLNLYGPSRRAGANPDGLFGESRAGDHTFLGEMEELVRRGPEPAARPAAAGPTRGGLRR
jgi:hypothetical protein